MDIDRRSTLTRCEKCEDCFTKFGIFMLNLIDFLLGCMFLTFGIYMYMKLGSDVTDSETMAWISFLSLLIGILLLLIVLLSFASLNLTQCKIGVVLSGYLALFVSVAALIVGVVSTAVKAELFNYLDNHRKDIGLSASDVESIKSWFMFILVALFCSAFLEFIRFHWSYFLYSNYSKMEGRYQRLLVAEDEENEIKFNENKAQRAEKYDVLRTHYKNKYTSNLINESDNSF